MASARLNIFENFPHHPYPLFNDGVASNGVPTFIGVYIPGSISFNTAAIKVSFSVGTSNSISFSFGLYSLNGATLSLANSASYSTQGITGFSWVTMATSAAQDITPGIWYLALQRSRNVAAASFSYLQNLTADVINKPIGGPFIRGRATVSSAGMQATFATSDLQKEGSSSVNSTHVKPYILISA